MVQPVQASTTAAKSTAPVEITSFRLSAAVACRVAESMRRPKVRLNRAIHSFTKMDISRTPATTGENSTGEGRNIFFTEFLASSTPMTRIRAATARPEIYSTRA